MNIFRSLDMPWEESTELKRLKLEDRVGEARFARSSFHQYRASIPQVKILLSELLSFCSLVTVPLK